MWTKETRKYIYIYIYIYIYTYIYIYILYVHIYTCLCIYVVCVCVCVCVCGWVGGCGCVRGYVYWEYVCHVISKVWKGNSSLVQTLTKNKHNLNWMVKFVKTWNLSPQSSHAHSFLSINKNLGKRLSCIWFLKFLPIV